MTTLATTLKRAAAAAGSRDIIATALLCSDGDALTITTTDYDVTLWQTLAAPGVAPLSAAIPAAALAQTVAACGADVTIAPSGSGDVDIRSGRSRFVLRGLPVADYPAIDPPDTTATKLLDMRALGAVATVCSTDESRPALNGVLITGDRYVATDGHRLHVATVREPVEGITPWTLHRRALGMLSGLDGLRAAPGVVAGSADGAVVTIAVREVPEAFPSWERVVPEPQPRVWVDSSALASALRRISAMVDKRGLVRVEVSGGMLALDGVRSDVGDGHDEVPVQSGDDSDAVSMPVMGCNPRYMLDALAACGTERVAVEWTGEHTPIVMTSSDGGVVCIVMPMRL